MTSLDSCDGPLVWFDVDMLDGSKQAILECGNCPYIVVTGNWNDHRHNETPVLKP